MLSNFSKWLMNEYEEESVPVREPLRLAIPGIPGQKDCVLVLDASASMEFDDWTPSRLDGAKHAALEFCKKLCSENPDARVAIVAYGCQAMTYCELTPVKQLSVIQEAINGFDCLGSTNMKAGLTEALRILSYSNGPCQVIFLSDGENTDQSPIGIARKLKKIAEIDCVGIGGSPHNVDEALLKKIASTHPNGSPRYRWIGDKEQLVEHFEQLAGRICRQ